MNTLRWIAFLPTALLASLIAGSIGYYLGGSAWAYFFDEGNTVSSWLISGVASGFVFVLVGIKVAPKKTNGVKLILAIIAMALGGISAVGCLLFGGEDQDVATALAGIAMVLVAIVIIRIPVKDLEIL